MHLSKNLIKWKETKQKHFYIDKTLRTVANRSNLFQTQTLFMTKNMYKNKNTFKFRCPIKKKKK